MIQIFTKKKRNIGEINPEDILIDASNIPNFDYNQMEGRLKIGLKKSSLYAIGILFACFLIFYIYKMYDLQIYNYEKYSQLSERNRFRASPIFPKRGSITDRNGVALAWNEVSTDSPIILRRYIEDEGYSNLLGYISYPKVDKTGVFWQSIYEGKDGIEKEYQDKLSGVVGSHIYEVAATGEIIPGVITRESQDGEELRLNIDSKIQSKMYELIKGLAIDKGFRGGAGAIMNVNTGQLIALTSYPQYDNNIMTNANTEEEKDMIIDWLDDKDHKFMNRVVSGLYIPGSTVKPFIAYSALKENVIDEYKNILSTGALIIKNKYGGPDTVFKDWKEHGYADMRHAIAVSSDEYFYHIGGGYQDQSGLGIDNIYRYMSGFGFASSTGIDMPEEKSGTIPNREWKKQNYKEGEWKLGDTYHTSIGQYGFRTTPIELLRSTSLLANGQYLLTPRVYGSSTDKLKVDMDAKMLQVVRQGMRLAVTDQNIGTVRSLYVSGIDVAAKSGTAELGVKKDRVNSWVMGYYPYQNPKYAFVIIMESGDANNLIGASSVMRQLLQYIVENKKDFEYMF